MDEAATLFLRHGYEGTSLRQLADVVGMKAGSLYYHFASKDELLTEILRRGIDVMQTAFDEAEARHDRRLARARRVAAHVRAHLAALYENGPYTAAHVITFRTSPDGRPRTTSCHSATRTKPAGPSCSAICSSDRCDRGRTSTPTSPGSHCSAR